MWYYYNSTSFYLFLIAEGITTAPPPSAFTGARSRVKREMGWCPIIVSTRWGRIFCFFSILLMEWPFSINPIIYGLFPSIHSYNMLFSSKSSVTVRRQNLAWALKQSLAWVPQIVLLTTNHTLSFAHIKR